MAESSIGTPTPAVSPSGRDSAGVVGARFYGRCGTREAYDLNGEGAIGTTGAISELAISVEPPTIDATVGKSRARVKTASADLSDVCEAGHRDRGRACVGGAVTQSSIVVSAPASSCAV